MNEYINVNKCIYTVHGMENPWKPAACWPGQLRSKSASKLKRDDEARGPERRSSRKWSGQNLRKKHLIKDKKTSFGNMFFCFFSTSFEIFGEAVARQKAFYQEPLASAPLPGDPAQWSGVVLGPTSTPTNFGTKQPLEFDHHTWCCDLPGWGWRIMGSCSLPPEDDKFWGLCSAHLRLERTIQSHWLFT